MELIVDAVRFVWPSGFGVGPVSWQLGPGVFHLVGPNGSGKTTLLRVLGGALPPASGQVRCGGDVHRDPRARRHVALVPAQPDLPEFLTVDEAWRTLAGLRGAPDWEGRALRDALDLPGDLLLRHASSGQRRRAELLAALAGDPDVVLLDETFAFLDVHGREVLAEWLDAWRSWRVIVASHHGPLPVQADGTLELGAAVAQ